MHGKSASVRSTLRGVKVGLLDRLGVRHTAYWAAFLAELGIEVVTPALPLAEAVALGRESLPDEPLQVQVALGRILELGRCDVVLLPETSAVAQDAWGEALAELLPRRISGLPTLLTVPDSAEQLRGAAADLGQKLTHNAALVRLALDRVKLPSPREDMPLLAQGSRVSLGIIGPRSLVGDRELTLPLRQYLESLDCHPVWAADLPVTQVLTRAARMENAQNALLGEKELFGALKLLEGKSAVRGFVLLAPARDGAMRRALEKLKTHKPTLLLELDADQTEWPELAAFVERLEVGASHREAEA